MLLQTHIEDDEEDYESNEEAPPASDDDDEEDEDEDDGNGLGAGMFQLLCASTHHTAVHNKM